MPVSIASPATASATPIHTVAPARMRNSTSATSGVSTTYIPVTNPAAETVVRSSPAVTAVPGRQQRAEPRADERTTASPSAARRPESRATTA